MKQINWYGLYNESWQGEITPDAFAHPAKFSRGLIRKIYQHMIDRGWLVEGDKVVDSFGGVALGAADAMRLGLHWEGVELEPRFVELGNQNIGLWNGRYAGWFDTWGTAVLHQGDSRQLAAIVGGGDGVVSSPPFMESGADGTKNHNVKINRNRQVISKNRSVGLEHGDAEPIIYADNTPGQLGAMPQGSHHAAVTSPAYADTIAGIGEGPGARWDGKTHPNNPNKRSSQAAYGRSAGQLGQMDAGVYSPPFEESLSGKGKSPEFRLDGSPFGQGRSIDLADYGSTTGNIGNDTGATFWQASRLILEQLYITLKPGGVAAFVCGDFVRQGQRVYFGQQWLDLCTAVGFQPLEWAVAWKTEYKGNQLDIFGNDHEKRIDRVSFFRRLANEKNPDNAILNEDVIFVQKPL